MKRNIRLLPFGFACSMALGAMAGSPAFGSVIDLGDATGFSVLATDGSISTSDSAFQGNVGVAASGFSFTQSGGGETNIQKPINVYLNTGSTFAQGTTNETVVQGASTNTFLQQAVSDATKASNYMAGLTPTAPNIGTISAGQTITGNSGLNVLNIGSINLNQSALTLDAPAGSTFVLNVSGAITMNGGSQGNGIRVAGGLTENNVFINVLGTGNDVNTTGGGNAQDIQGNVLDLGGSVNLHPGEIDGTIVAHNFTSSSGSLVAPPLNPVPEANAGFVLAALIPLMLLVTPARVKKALGAFRPVASA